MGAGQRSLIRYNRLRRTDEVDSNEDDFSFALGRYFQANCLVSDDVNHCIRIVGSTGGLPDVTRVDRTDATKMPAVGIILSKSSPTRCLVQILGLTTTLMGLSPGHRYFVGGDSKPTIVEPAPSVIKQVLGYATDPSTLLVIPNFGTNDPVPSVSIPITFSDDTVLIGVKNGFNRTFNTPTTFLNTIQSKIKVYHNGRKLKYSLTPDPSVGEFVVSESGGVGTGFDTVNLLTFSPIPTSVLTADYIVG